MARNRHRTPSVHFSGSDRGLHRVLLVDDDSDFIDVACLYLEDHHFGTYYAKALSAHDALEMLKDENFDAIVCDYQMPEMDGLKLLELLRNQADDIPFIIFTGRGREEVAMRALNLGADYYLMKGVDPESMFGELAHIINQVISLRHTERALRESEERYRRMADNISDGLKIIERGQVVYVNDRLCEIFGYLREELVTLKTLDIVAPEDKARVTLHLEAARKRQEAPEELEFWIIRKDGTWCCIQNRYSITADGSHFVITTDITQRKRAEEALRESEELFSKAFRSSPVAMIISRLSDGVILEANKICETILGYSQNELIGSSSVELGLTRPEERDQLRQLLSEKGRFQNVEASFFTKAGQERLALLSGEVIELGGEQCLIWIAIDITERQKAESLL
ncbi:MAG: PAS domain S-box protein [Candidatus Hodarchaeales archaeon]